jgi:hypothetical protein
MSPQQAVELRTPPPSPPEEGQVQGLWGEEGCPQNGDGTPPRCENGVEHLLAGCSVRDPDSPHPAAELKCHHPRVPEYGRGSGQRPLHI